MSAPLPLSVALVTLNEESHLPRCLERIRPLAAEIVIVDSGSTDGTAEVARSYGARFEVLPWRGFIGQKQEAWRRCTQPWVLNLDADEVLTPELTASMQAAFADGDPRVDGFWLNRRTFYLGDWIWHAWYPDWILRLARREAAQWGGLDPHARLEVAGPTARLQGDLLHYSFKDLADHLHRTLRYARVMARSQAAGGRPFRWRRLWLSPGAALIKQLVFKQGFRDGWRGWLIAGVAAVGTFAKYAFLLEAERSAPHKKGTATGKARPE